MLLLQDSQLFKYFQSLGTPLPFSISTLRKDRLDGRLGVPYLTIGGAKLYCPDLVFKWLAGVPVVIPKPHAITKQNIKKGKPSKQESVEAERLGLTVKEFRAKKGVKNV